MSASTLRFGILGAARIAPPALVDPARAVDGAIVAGIAARDPERAEAFAKEHGVERVYATYADLVDAPDLDCIYNALPISHHCEWTLRALEAGKHVLCEKAMASNADEAQRMAQASRRAGRVLVEAFHWRYHPLAARLIEVARSELGTLERLEASFTVPHIQPDDIRMIYATGGGATMDLGCYPIHMLRHVVGQEPVVTSARAEVGPPDVDVSLEAELEFPGGAHGRISSSMSGGFAMSLEAHGSGGSLHATNPLAPQLGHRLRVETGEGTREETCPGETTYLHQLEAFVTAVRDGGPLPTDAEDAVRNMRVIDACYRTAGLRVRGT